MRPRRSAHLFAAALLLGAGGLAACSDDDQDEARDRAEEIADDARERAEEATATATARATAEAIRAGLKANGTADDEGVRSMKAIEEVLEDVEDAPGEPEITGVEDADGDGMDDDGRIQVTSGDAESCVILPEEGEDTTVEQGAC